MSLKQQAVSGIKWTSVSSIIITIIQLAQLVIVARYLDPSDFGLMAIVSVVIGFSALFMDLGISASIIHRQDITHEQLSSLFWLNIASGLFVFLVVYSLAAIISNFYHETELIDITRLLAITFIITAFGNQYSLLIQKALQFNFIAKINIASATSSFTVAVTLAMLNYGVYALVYASIAGAMTTTIINVIIGTKKYKPSLVYRHDEIRPMITFGLFQMGEKGINYFNSQFDVILIGKLLGTEALGIYSVAKNLSMRPAQIINPIITTVTFPLMAKVQDDTDRLKTIYLNTINYLSSVNFPIYILLALLAEPVVLILFGEQWSDSIVILQILSIYGALRSTGNPVGFLLLARGRADLGFYWNLCLFIFIPFAIYIGSYWGLNGVASSLLILMAVLSVPSWYFLVEPLCGAKFKEYFWQMIKPLILSTISAGIGFGISLSLISIDSIMQVIVILFGMGVPLLFLYIIFNRNFLYIIYELIVSQKNSRH